MTAIVIRYDDELLRTPLSSILFNLLYTVYSIPNVVLPFFGGYFVDKLTARLMNIVFCGSILVGQITLTIGCFLGSFPLMILGR